jgi:choice-of-anchor B domain-containing protein
LRYLLLVFMVSHFFLHAQYAHDHIELLSHWDDSTLTSIQDTNKIKYSSVYGWYDPVQKREYAILGGHAGTYFIEVTNPAHPQLRDFVPGRRDSCVWREYNTYGHYAYMISDDGGNNSFQIADLSFLPDSVHLVHDDTTIITRAHTLFVEDDRLYLATPKGNWGKTHMAVLSLSNPEKPVMMRKLEQDYPALDDVHDMFVSHDTVYVSDGFRGLFIFKQHPDFTFSLIESLTSYVKQGYNHSSSLTPDGHTLIFCDEIPASLPVKALDVRDFSNLDILDTFRCVPNSTPHNPYVLNNQRVVITYYADGVQVFNISDPDSITRSGYFDTDTLDNNGVYRNSYNGCWGAYIYLPSGVLLASDRQNGLYVLDASEAYGVEKKKIPENNHWSIFPNPASDKLFFHLSLKEHTTFSLEIIDAKGSVVMQQYITADHGDTQFSLPIAGFAQGVYLVRIHNESESYCQKIIKD